LTVLVVGWCKGDRMILVGYVPFVMLSILQTRALLSSDDACDSGIGMMTFFVYFLIPVFHAVWINDAMFKWGAVFTQTFRTQGETTERLASGLETGEKKSSDVRKYHDETVAKYVLHREKMKFVAFTCAVVVAGFFVYLHIFGNEEAFCVARGEMFGTLSWSFLDIVPYPSAFAFFADWFGTYMHCDGAWWIGNCLRIAGTVAYFICYVVVLSAYRGEGNPEIEYKRGFLFHLLLLALPLFVLPTFLVAGTETLSIVIGGPFGIFGASTILGLSIVLESLAVKFFKYRYIIIPEIPGLEGPKLAFHRRSDSAFPFGKKLGNRK